MDRLRPRSSEEGFTLGELLVVISIIGILVAIAIPVFLHQRRRAVDATVLADVRTLVNAVEDAKVNCTNATIFDIIPRNGLNGGRAITYQAYNGTTVGPFGTWHTLSYDEWRQNGGLIRIYHGYTANQCVMPDITLSPGTNIHLIQEGTTSSPVYGEYRLYGWNPNGKKYNGSTLELNSNRAHLTQEEMESVVTYISVDGGLKK